MHSHCRKKISSGNDYLLDFFGLLIALSITIRYTRSYFYPSLILRRMHSQYENKISRDGAYLRGICLVY